MYVRAYHFTSERELIDDASVCGGKYVRVHTTRGMKVCKGDGEEEERIAISQEKYDENIHRYLCAYLLFETSGVRASICVVEWKKRSFHTTYQSN